MLKKGKKGQFFFVATLIIVTVILSLTSIYNSVSAEKDDSIYKSLVTDLKYEATFIIDNGYQNNLSFDNINKNVVNFTLLYSQNYPNYNFTIITGDSKDLSSFKYYSFKKGIYYDPVAILTFPDKKVSLSLYSSKYNFTLSRGFNFNAIIIGENEKGRFIASA